MRFAEFQNTDKDLESALVNTLTNMRGDANDDKEIATVSMDALHQLMTNLGYPTFNYDLFKKIYDNSKTLKNIVNDFDREKIIVNTEKEADKNPAMDFDNQGSTDTVSKMAKSALKKRQ